MKRLALIVALFALNCAGFAQAIYTLDKNHARLSFSVVHFGISHIEGNFKAFDATLKTTKDDFSDATIEMTAQAKSINTEVDMRDADLRSSNWFDADKYPVVNFKSTSFKSTDGKNYKLEGTITMHGVTKPIVFDVTYNGKGLNPFSKKYSVGFTITGKLKRSDFGIGSDATSTGVSDEIELKSNVEFIIN